MSIDPNAPAYPNTTARDTGSKIVYDVTGGMSIRAEIASRIMAGLCANTTTTGARSPQGMVDHAIFLTDALLTTLNEPKA